MPYNSIRRPERARQNQTLRHAAVAHLVERHLAKVEVASSSLVGRSISEIWFQAAGLHLVQALQANQVGSFLCGPVVQLVRTLACHARGRQFEPDPGRHYASVAQSVEQGTENPRVIGSIPIGGTRKRPKLLISFGRFFCISPSPPISLLALFPRLCQNQKNV